MLSKIKNNLKKVPPIFYLNSKIRSLQVERQYHSLVKYYSKIKQTKSLCELLYNNGFTHEWHKNLCGHKPVILYVGTDEFQDKSGFIQALNQFAIVIPFVQEDGCWGQSRGNDKPNNGKHRNGITLTNILSENKTKGIIPDIVLMQSWGFSFDLKLLRDLKKEYCFKLINIGMDERLAYKLKTPKGQNENGISGLNSVVDLVLVTTIETVEWYLKENVPAVYFPLASSPSFYYPINSTKRYEIGFIGQKYGIRGYIVRKLINEGFKVKAYGPGWSSGKLPLSENNKFFNECKILLGIGTIGYCKNFYNPKLRDFDAPMSGNLYLTNRTIELEKLYSNKENIVFYDDINDLISKVKFYLANDAEREKIANAAREHVLKYHTYEHRIEKLLQNLSSDLCTIDLFDN